MKSEKIEIWQKAWKMLLRNRNVFQVLIVNIKILWEIMFNIISLILVVKNLLPF